MVLDGFLRIYAEVGWAFYSVASEPWEVQFGLDFAPRVATGLHGAPFFAVNGHLREELDFGGGLNVQVGWAWRADMTAHLLRLGFQYYNGASTQYAFLPFHETQYGLVFWYDFFLKPLPGNRRRVSHQTHFGHRRRRLPGLASLRTPGRGRP